MKICSSMVSHSDPDGIEMTVEINHRSSDNNDSDLEWEIYVSSASEYQMIKRLGNVAPIQVGTTGNAIYLPKGVHAALAGELAASLAALDWNSFQVLVEQCRRPTPVAVCLLVQDGGGKILAVSRKKDFHKPESEWRFGLPGGKVDPGEKDLTALVREVDEETGYAVHDSGGASSTLHSGTGRNLSA